MHSIFMTEHSQTSIFFAPINDFRVTYDNIDNDMSDQVHDKTHHEAHAKTHDKKERKLDPRQGPLGPATVISDMDMRTMPNIVAYLYTDNSEVEETIIGIGGSGIVIYQEELAVKIPKLRRRVQLINGERMIGRLTPRPGDYDERKVAIKALKEEKAVYKRVQGPGIVPCYELDSDDHSIKMKFMVNGDLRHYLSAIRPDQQTQIAWLTDLAQTYANIHNCRVVVDDIRSDNILLDENFNVRVVDFGNSILMPLDWDLQGDVDEGSSIASDIGQFGAVIFEIVTGQHCKFDPLHEWTGDPHPWPPRHSLPVTTDIWLGEIIERCWTRDLSSFVSMEELLLALKKEFAKIPRGSKNQRSCLYP